MSVTLSINGRVVCAGLAWWLLSGGLTAADEHQQKHQNASEIIDEQAGVITVRPSRDVISKQALN